MAEGFHLTMRKGEERDIADLVDAIVAAEKSGTEIFSYSNIFEMPEEEVRRILALILAEDVPGQELCFSHYLIAEVNGKFAGTIAAWIEGESGQRSAMIKATLLNYFIPEANMAKAQEKRKYLDQMHFDPALNTLVFESATTLPQFRGHRIISKLILEHIRIQQERRPDLKTALLQVMKNNYAILVYNKIGFNIVRELTCDDPVILKWLPGDTRIIMEKEI